jgi:hypothetical protein
MPMTGDAEKDLALVLSYLTGRRLTLEEVLAAVEMSRSTYYDRQGKGTLTTTDTLLTAARNLGLNPVDLLVRYGRIAPTDVADYVEEEGHPFGLVTARRSTLTSRRERRVRGRAATVPKLQPRSDAPPL